MRTQKLIGTTGTGTHSLPSKRLAFNKLNLQTTKTKNTTSVKATIPKVQKHGHGLKNITFIFSQISKNTQKPSHPISNFKDNKNHFRLNNISKRQECINKRIICINIQLV